MESLGRDPGRAALKGSALKRSAQGERAGWAEKPRKARPKEARKTAQRAGRQARLSAQVLPSAPKVTKCARSGKRER